MTYGFNVFDGFGAPQIDEETQVIRAIRRLEISAGSSGSVSIPDFDENKGVISYQTGSADFDSGSSWDNTNKVFSWSNPNYNFAADFFEFT